jgi:hypothetical protein
MGDWMTEQQNMTMRQEMSVRNALSGQYTYMGSGIKSGYFGGVDPIDPIKPEPKPDKKLLLL